MYGYAGNILWVDLNIRECRKEPTQKYIEWIGGRSLGTYLLSRQIDLLKSETAQQPIVISAGPLVGTGIPLGTRTAVSARNQISKGFCFSNVGGDFGTRLKMAGFDAVVIQGASSEPVHLLIEGGHCTISAADDLWGLQITPLQKALFKKYGDEKLSFIGIGPSGENEALISCLMVDQAHAAGWGGSGGIFGAKKLKAIAARGDKSISVYDEKKLKEKIKQLELRINASEAIAGLMRGGTHGMASGGGYSGLVPTAVRNLQDEYLSPKEWAPIKEDAYRRWQNKRMGCVGCTIRCLHYYSVNSDIYGKLEVEGMHSNSVRGLGSNFGVSDPIELLMMHKLVNEYGMDVDGVSAAIAFALECADHGILEREQYGEVTLEWGDGSSLVELIKQMGERTTSLGKLLSNGVYEAAREIGDDSAQFALTTKRVGINEQGVRSHRAWMLGMMTSTRGGGHLGGSPQTENRRISAEVGERLLGNPKAGDPLAYEGKGRLVAQTDGFKAIIDSLGLCYFVYGWYDLSIGQIEELAEMLYLVSGIKLDGNDLLSRGMRTHTLERFLTHHLGDFSRKDDQLPDRFYKTEVSSGPYKGAHLELEHVEQALDEYYATLEWDVKTGLPTPELLFRMGLGYLLIKKEGKT